MYDVKQTIAEGRAVLGIELGSTRIKAVLIDENNKPIADGGHSWENQLKDGIWTYPLDAVWSGLQACYRDLQKNMEARYGIKAPRFAAIGISAMMHGYMAFDRQGALLAPFRTWRNTITGEASAALSALFDYNIPQRWSVAHLYQAIQNGESHVSQIDYLTTLSGYIHWKLTGKKVIGVGDASGMFPIDTATGQFNARMIEQFDKEIEPRRLPWKLEQILPQVLAAGEQAGYLTEEGAKLLDCSGELQAGIPLCPPEGDAGTGMVATNSVATRAGNVSAGTSVFAMVVLEKELSRVYPEIDLVTTPSGNLVAMVHCNNCTSDLNAWVNLFREFAETFGMKIEMEDLFGTLYQKALNADADCGGLLAYNYFSGEHITGFEEGRPLFVRLPDAEFNLANFMRTHLFTALGGLKTGMDILLRREHVKLNVMLGHGGFFKTKGVGQSIMAAAVDTPVLVMETAGEGGAWGIALLASYLIRGEGSLAEYLEQKVFAGEKGVRVEPEPELQKGFERFMERYTRGLPIERAAVDWLSEEA